MGLELITAPAASPVALADVKAHAGLEDGSFDALLGTLLLGTHDVKFEDDEELRQLVARRLAAECG